MQSRIAVTKLRRLLFATPRNQHFGRAAFSSGGGVHGDDGETGDAMSQGVDTEGETGDVPLEENRNGDKITPTKEDDHYVRPKVAPPNLSSPKLETPAVNDPLDPHLQQKRKKSGVSKTEFTCAGLDGSPWPEDDSDRREQRREQEEDDKEYFEDHKASPLSDIEIAETRKPLTIVTSGTADSYFGDEKVLTWRPEQLDTAEDSLRRAMEMFRLSATRGIPDYPHSRRLRELRGEDW